MKSHFKKVDPTPIDDFDRLFADFNTHKAVSRSRKLTYAQAATMMASFCMEEHGEPNPPLAVFDVRLLIRFRLWLLKQTNRRFKDKKQGTKIAPTTAETYINVIKAMFKYAERMSLLPTYVFKNYDSPIDNVVKHGSDHLDRKVSKDNLGRIENTVLGHPVLENTRLIFLFQRWTGMAWADLHHYGANITDCFQTDYLERKVVQYNRIKTGEIAIIPLFPEIESIVKKLKGDVAPGNYRRYRDRVIRLFEFFEIPSDGIGTHTGRHVFGSEMLETGFTMESVSRMLGHSDIEETQRVYARINQEKIFADHAKVKQLQDVFKLNIKTE